MVFTRTHKVLGPVLTLRNMLVSYGEKLLAPRSTLKLEDHPLSGARDILFSTLTATLHSWRPSPLPAI